MFKKYLYLIYKTNKMKVFQLTSLDITNVGTMGSGTKEKIKFQKLFSTIKKAKDDAIKDYGKPIDWKLSGQNITSGDLGYIMYEIKTIEVL